MNARDITEFKLPAPTMAVSSGSILIPVPSPRDKRSSYDIELRRIATPTDLLQWTAHLAGKPWMDRKRLREFIRTVAHAKGWRL